MRIEYANTLHVMAKRTSKRKEEPDRQAVFLNEDLLGKANTMADANFQSFPKFIAWLVNQEWERRNADKKVAA